MASHYDGAKYMDILNLGAGNKIVCAEGAINHDRTRHRPEIDIVWDLNQMPWPWDDNSFDVIVARAVFEHLKPDLVEVMNECWRILRPDGAIHLKLPNVASLRSHDDPTHRWFATLRTLDYFDPDTERGKAYSFYTDRHWQIIKAPHFNRAQTSIFAVLKVRK